jgi:hypothetical protein
MIFTLQKRTVRIIAGVKSRNSCRNLFMNVGILPLACEYMFTWITFVVNNQKLYRKIQQNVNSRDRYHLLRPIANVSCFRNSAYYLGINIFNSIPSSLRSLMNKRAQFKVALNTYLKMLTPFTLFMNSWRLKMYHNIYKMFLKLLFVVWTLCILC